MSWLATWWVWIAGALAFAILETLAPVFVFLGFTIGALSVGALIFVGFDFGNSFAWMIVTFAAVSLISTLGLRMVMGTRENEVKTFTDDING